MQIVHLTATWSSDTVCDKSKVLARPKPTFVAEVVPAASCITGWTGRAGGSMLVGGMTPPVPTGNRTTTGILGLSAAQGF